jgi:hemerythrin-like metal-binding protein
MSQKTVFEWDAQKFTTYVGPMDREHEKLVQIMNRLYTENENGAPKSQLLRTAEELGRWTKEHFDHEEAYFSKISNYKSVNVHKTIHANLLRDFTAHVEKFKAGGDKVPHEFFLFLKVWLSAHICGVDRKYGELAKAQ